MSLPYSATCAGDTAVSTRESFVELESYAGRGLPRDNAGTHRGALDQRNAQTASVFTLLPPVEASAVVDFWREAGPERWFAKDANFDLRFRERFLPWHQAAAHGYLGNWAATATGALALVLLLDQFPRNAFRNTARMYATDARARQVAAAAIDAGHDFMVPTDLQPFFYLPFGHSESVLDQEHSVTFNRRLGQPHLSHAERHRDIIRRFGRFPHRNPILERTMTPEEQRFLDEGGYAG